ncbi:MAG: hypothetical protein U0575_05655 [Phycisphaerales bacterium]
MLCCTAIGLALGHAANVSHAQTIVFVKPNTPNGNDGQSWGTAYDSLWDCLDDLPSGGLYHIHVAAGTYRPPVGQQPVPPFAIREDVRVFGGFPGVSELETLADRLPDTHIVVLTGDVIATPSGVCGDPQAGSCYEPHAMPNCNDADCCAAVCLDLPACCSVAWDQDCVDLVVGFCGPPIETRADHVVVTEGDGTVRRLDGVTVKDGGNGPMAFDAAKGGGIWVNGNFFGEPVHLDVVRCKVRENYADQGGGIAVTTGVPSSFPDDDARVRIWNCRIEDNLAKVYGGGLLAESHSSYEIVNSVIAANGFTGTGGEFEYQSGGAILENITVDGVDRKVVNSTITRNTGAHPGIFQLGIALYDEDLTILNSIVRGNLFPDLQETEECKELSDDCPEIVGTPTIRFSNINLAEDALPIGCINVDPQFVYADGGDYTLQETSLCVDAGDDDEMLPDLLDVNNNFSTTTEDGPDLELKFRRRVGTPGACPTVDMGAHELQGYCKLGDFDDDDDVDGADLGVFLSLWGPCAGSPCQGDFDCSNTVDGGDLGLLLGVWGPGHPRGCVGGGSFAAGGAIASGSTFEGDGLTLQELSSTLGFATMADFVDWVSSLPFNEMKFYLDMLAG